MVDLARMTCSDDSVSHWNHYVRETCKVGNAPDQDSVEFLADGVRRLAMEAELISQCHCIFEDISEDGP